VARAGLVALTGKVGAWPNSKKEEEDYLSRQCCGSMTFWCGSGDPRLRQMDPDPDADPAIFVRTFKMPTKNKFLKKSFLAYHFLKVHLHHFQKIKSQKAVGIKVFRTIFAL
jgi:hypothetical protein